MSTPDGLIYSPMLIGAESEAFDSPDYLSELKLDGVRGLAYLGDNTRLLNKRHLDISARYPELKGIHRQAARPCILDGEITAIIDGKPCFSEMQRRSILSDPFKIKLAAAQHPVCFTAFDILWLDGQDLTSHPLQERKVRLAETVEDTAQVAVSRFILEQGRALYTLVEEQELEGVVAKRLSSLYFPGKRTKDWIKMKRYGDEDFVILGYIRKSGGMTSLILGQYRDGVMVYKGHVTLGVSGRNYKRVTEAPRAQPPFSPIPKGNDDAVWIQPELVCVVQYMEKSAQGSMRQPVFKGLRVDKEAAECMEAK